MQQQTELWNAIDGTLELAEKVFSFSNDNLQITLQLWIKNPGDAELLLAKRAENSAQIGLLIQELRNRLQTPEEMDLLDAATPRTSLIADYGELLQQITDGRASDGASTASANLMLPLLLDHSSWRAFVEFLRVRLNSEGNSEEMATRTRELIRQNQMLKSVVAERKRLEERLSQLSSLIEGATDAIVICTMGGTIVNWNAGAEALYGYSANEVLGRSRYMLLAPDHADGVPGIIDKIQRGERVETCEAVHLRKGGQRVAVSMAVSSVKDVGGKVVGFVTITRNANPRKESPRSGSRN